MIRFSFILSTCLWLTLFLNPELVLSDNLMKAPYAKRPIQSRPFYQTSTVKFVTKGLINFYSNVISPVDGPRSPSYPTGSEYGRQVIERHGFFAGIILTADRLLHEADISLSPIINIYGVDRYFDPPENNTFWWSETNRDKK